MTTNWDAEDEVAKKVVDAGYEAGLEKFRALAVGGDAPEIDEDMTAFVETIYKPWNEYPGVGWGKVVRKQEKAVKKLEKTFVHDLIGLI